MAAALLTRSESVLHEVPRLADVETMRAILCALGVGAEWVGPNSLRLTPGECDVCEPPPDLVRRMRASVCTLGPLLARRGHGRPGPARRLRAGQAPHRPAPEGPGGAGGASS